MNNLIKSKRVWLHCSYQKSMNFKCEKIRFICLNLYFDHVFHLLNLLKSNCDFKKSVKWSIHSWRNGSANWSYFIRKEERTNKNSEDVLEDANDEEGITKCRAPTFLSSISEKPFANDFKEEDDLWDLFILFWNHLVQNVLK